MRDEHFAHSRALVIGLRANEVYRLAGSDLKPRRTIGHVPATPLERAFEGMFESAVGRDGST